MVEYIVMESIFYIFAFIFGTIIGSFLNVVIYRYNTGTSIVSGRSMCFSCGKTLKWYELVPIFSFILQRAKCRNCKSKISWQYPVVEIVMGLLFVFVLIGQHSIIETIYLFILMSIFVVISVYDIRHKIIPNSFVYAFILLSVLQFTWGSNTQVLDWLAGPILFLPFAGLWFFSKGTWMGFGDAKLALGIGWFLGFYAGMSAIIFAFWIGSVFGLTLIGIGKTKSLLLGKKKFTIKSEIPFGPFLLIGTLLVFFLNINVVSLLRIF